MVSPLGRIRAAPGILKLTPLFLLPLPQLPSTFFYFLLIVSEHFGLLLFGFKSLDDFILDGYLFAFQDSLLHQGSQDISDRLQIAASQNDLFSKI